MFECFDSFNNLLKSYWPHYHSKLNDSKSTFSVITFEKIFLRILNHFLTIIYLIPHWSTVWIIKFSFLFFLTKIFFYFKKSAIIYQSIIDNDKHWLEGADLYSSALFFQTDYNMLGYFATRMKQFFFLNEQTWVAISNLYGLKSDKKNQTIALQRAIQLNPNYAYAHMLLGCQHYEANNFDKALECFKQCLINDPLFYL